MEAELERRFLEYEKAPVNWDPVSGGKKAFICFRDSITGGSSDEQATEEDFERAAEKMLSGNYYPPDAVEFFGRFRDENRNLQPGDRVLQRARLLPFYDRLYVYSMVEIYVAERTDTHCRIGYVTTTKHHGRGIWTATLVRGPEMSLEIESIASPNSWLFWIGLPYARYLQMRARIRGIQNMMGC